MATPIIQSTQATPGAGTAGQGRNDLVLSESVTLSDTEAANGSASYLWEFEDIPIGSAAALISYATPTPNFTPDVVGSYRVKCTVDGSLFAVEVLAVPLPVTGARIPSYREQLEYDAGSNAQGWHESQDQFMRAVDTALGSVGDVAVAVSGDDTTPGNLEAKVVAGTNITLATLNPGANETLEISATSGAHNHAASEITSGTLDDARVAQSNVTQHQAALSITESQISDLAHTAAGGLNHPSDYSAEFGNPSNNSAQATNALFDVPTDITCECWFKPNTIDATDQALFGKGRTSSLNNNYALMVKDSLFRFQVRGAADQTMDVSEAVTNPAGEWHHYAATREGSTGDTKLFLDGVQLGTTTTLHAGVDMDQTSNEFRLGSEALQTQPIENGRIFEARVWNVVRTPQEIRNNFKLALAGTEVGLVAYYKLENNWNDSGPNGLTLTPASAPSFEVDVPFALRSASSLENLGGIVRIAGDAPPASGEVLTSDGAGNAAFLAPPGGVDTTAIHKATAGEINALTAKGTPVAADVIVLEDSEDSFNKKKIDLTNLLGGSSGPIAAAQGDYVTALLGADYTTALVLPQRVPFDTIGSQRGDLNVDLVTNIGRVTGLKAGRTYHLYGSVVTSTTASYFQYRWYDLTEGEYVGNDAYALSNNRTSTVSDTPGATHMFTPKVDTEIELRIHGTSDVNYDINGDNFTQIIVHEIGAVQADVVGGLEFMDIITVTADQTSVSFGAAGDGAFQRALDGDVDEEYVIAGTILRGSASGMFYELRPNGVSTNQKTMRVSSSGSTPFGTNQATLTMAQGTAAIGVPHGIETIFRSRTGQNRTFRSHSDVCVDSTTIEGLWYSGGWADTVTVVNSLEILATVAGGIGSGTRLILYRRTRTNLRADSAAVYERMAVETITPGALVTTERTVGHSIYGGSVVGVSARIEKAITGGNVTINVKVDGSTVLTTVLDTTNPTSKVERLAIGLAKFAADKNISVEFVPGATGFAPPSEPVTVTVQVHLTNSGLVTQNDRVVARTVLSADATTLSVAGLNGDLDGTYEIEGDLIIDPAIISISAQPNGSTANIFSVSALLDVTKTHLAGEWRIMSQGVAVGTYHYIRFRMIFFAARTKNGVARNRSYYCDGSEDFDFNATVHNNTFVSSGTLENQTANLTSLDFVSSLASGIKAGSEIVVRRVKA